MPYVLLALGIILGLWGLYKFITTANIHQISALFLTVFVIAVGLGAFVLAVTGRLPAAIAVVVAVLPVLLPILKKRHRKEETIAQEFFKQKHNPATNRDTPLSRTEALNILGLEEDANEDEIKAAYKKLIKKVHPDQEGSAWMAAKLNKARDILLGKADTKQRD